MPPACSVTSEQFLWGFGEQLAVSRLSLLQLTPYFVLLSFLGKNTAFFPLMAPAILGTQYFTR